MPLFIANLPFPILANQLPPLPAGPTLDNVRGPIEVGRSFETWQIALTALSVLLIAGAFIWLYLRSRKQEPTPIAPYDAAMSELDAASQAADDEQFAMLCANAVRRVLEACFDLPATSQTSAEIEAQLPLDSEDKSSIRSFLKNCDGVKFAGQAFSEPQRAELLETAKFLIEKLQRKETADPA